MVKLTEVEDEHYAEEAAAAKLAEDEDDGDYTDTDSSISSDDENDETLEESFYERLTALADMVPPRQRTLIVNTFSKTSSLLTSGLRLGGKTLWVLSTSLVMLGVPYTIAVSEEQQMVEMEREMKAQQIASSSLSPGALPESQQPQQRL